MLTKAQVKYIQSLGHKKLRDSEQAFVAEGPKLINELLSAPNVQLRAMYAVDEFADEHPHISNIVRIRHSELERISSLSAPNNVVGIFSMPVFDAPRYSGAITLMLDGIQDPGNLGSIIRSADWFGVRNIICSHDCADNFNAKVVQSTMGSITRVRLEYTDLHQFLTQNKLPPLYATTLNGKNIFELGKVSEGVFIIGNESKGIHDELLQKAQHRITIPKKGAAESLNAGVATGIVLAVVSDRAT